jgi:hypothetical protein
MEQKCGTAVSPIFLPTKEAYRMAEEVIMGYCVKEKASKPMKDAEEIVLKNGKHALKGVCSSCGTKMMKFVSSKKPTATTAPAPSAPAEPEVKA